MLFVYCNTRRLQATSSFSRWGLKKEEAIHDQPTCDMVNCQRFVRFWDVCMCVAFRGYLMQRISV